MNTPLNTQNPEHLLYSYEQLHFEVLGGIKLDTLNSMRATIKVKHFTSEQRHTLDLYNNNALQRYVKAASDYLEVGNVYLQKATAALINELEIFRLQEQAKAKDKQIKPKVLTEQETKEALALLKTKHLTLKTNELLGKSGIVGEELNRIIMYLIFTTRKLQNPLHIISLAASGTGKSYLQEKVAQCIPEEDRKEITALSPNSFYYQGQTDLKHKLILLEDLTGAESSLYPIRELQSKKYIIKEVSHKNTKGETVTITKKVEGPVCIGACTTSENLYEDNANRSFLIYLDDSKEQDERIMQYQRKLHADKINKEEEQNAKQLLQNVQRLLKPVKIINPYAEYLHIPSEVFKKRRTNAHYLQFIEAITFYKQYQKPWIDSNTGEIIDNTIKNLELNTQNYFIQTDLEDIKEANNLLKHILLRKSDELNGATRNYLELLKNYLKENKQTEFKTKEVRTHYKLNYNSQKMYMLTLLQTGYIQKNTGNKKQGFTYNITDINEYKVLEEQIQKLLQQHEQLGIHEVKKLQEVVTPIQPLKANPVKESNQKLQKTLKPLHPTKNKTEQFTHPFYYELLTLCYPNLEKSFLLEDACKHLKRSPKVLTKHLNTLVHQQLITKTKKGLYNYYNIVAYSPIKARSLIV